MATPRTNDATPTTSILKCTKKTQPTPSVGLGKRVRFSVNSGPQTSQQGTPGGRERSRREPTGSSRKKSKPAVEDHQVPARGGVGQEEREESGESGLEEDEYEVEAILDDRRLRHEVEYLIKWKGYPDSENTWVPLSLMCCPEVLQEYRKKRQKTQTCKSSKSTSASHANKKRFGETKTRAQQPVREKKTPEEGKERCKAKEKSKQEGERKRERERERQKKEREEREREKEMEREKERELEMERQMEKEKERERQKEREEKERERQKEREEKERERQKEEREKEMAQGEMEMIINHRKRKDHREVEYLVQRRGYANNSWLPASQIAWGTLHHYLKNKVFCTRPQPTTQSKSPHDGKSPVSKRLVPLQSASTVNRAEPQGKNSTTYITTVLSSAHLRSPEYSRVITAPMNGLSVVPNHAQFPTTVNGSTAIVYIDSTILDSPPPSPLTTRRPAVRIAPSPRLSPLYSRLPKTPPPPHMASWAPSFPISPIRGLEQSPLLTSLSCSSSPSLRSPLNGFHLTLDPDTEREGSPVISGIQPTTPSPVIFIDSPPDSNSPSTPTLQQSNGLLRQSLHSRPLTSDKQCSKVTSPQTNGFKRPTVSPAGMKKLEDLLRKKLAAANGCKDKLVSGLRDGVGKTLLVNEVIWLSNGVIYRSPLSLHKANGKVTHHTNGETPEAWSRSRLRKRSRSVSPPPRAITAPPEKVVSKRRCSARLNGSMPNDSHSPPTSAPPAQPANQPEVCSVVTTTVLRSPPSLPAPPPTQLSTVPLSSKDERYQDQLMEWQYLLNKQRRGLEEIILVENTVDQAPIPTEFHYITSNHYSEGVPDPSRDNSPLTGCACYLLHKKCGPKAGHCCPHQAGAEFAYTLAGKVKLSPGKPIYECNRNCSCRPDCNNRVVQHGRQVPLCIFRTSNGRGWGVKALETIKPNTFVAEYVGEVITTEEAERRGKQYDREGTTYLFDLDFNDDPAFTIDAAKYGNISHFFNHSCDPNLVVYSVWIDTLDPRLPRIAFFTTRNISVGEELTFDYQMNHNQNTPRKTSGQVPCLCGAPNCIGFLD